MKAILIVVVAAAVSYFVWNHYFSRTAQIERAYAACVGKFSAGANGASADIHAKVPSDSDPSAQLSKGMADAMTSMMQGMAGATCGLIRETCKQDFDGPLCQAALHSSR